MYRPFSVKGHIKSLFAFLFYFTLIYFIYSSNGLCNTSYIASYLTNSRYSFSTLATSQSTTEDISTLKLMDLLEGTYVTTSGFYSENDGGAAKYIISSSPFVPDVINASIQLKNGLYANLVYSDAINVRQIGAKGDGINDDFLYFKSLANSGINIDIPNGTYNLNNNNLELTSFIKLDGTKNKPVLKDVTIIAPYGVELKNLTLDGGTTHEISMPGRQTFIGKFLLIVTPIGQTSIKYNNVIFQNADYGSFAMENKDNSPNRFSSDKAVNCTFSKLNRIGVYHCVDSDYTTYSKNKFTDIGDKTIINGTIGALKIGDTTNNTSIGSKNCNIMNNTFENLYSGNDMSATSHNIACNFITVFGEKAMISGNKFYNLLGYGEDRESIYTKVHTCTIKNNYIQNGGFGEGYICNKGRLDSNTFCTITGNNLEGEYGTGIQCYGPACINNNTINISHFERAISCIGRDENTNDELNVYSNTINASIDRYYLNSSLVSTYTPTYAIQVEGYITSVAVDKNQLNLSSPNGVSLNSVIRIGSIKKDSSLTGNIIKSTVPNCRGIEISAREEFQEMNKNCTIKILSNDISVTGQSISITLKGNTTATNRTFIVQGNTLSSTPHNEYDALIWDSDGNNDVLIFDNKTTGNDGSKSTLSTNVTNTTVK